MPNRKNKDLSPLAKAQSTRGRDPGDVIGGQVVERIVNNSTKEFQNYLASVGGGNAMAAANQAVSAAPPMALPEPAQFAAPPANGLDAGWMPPGLAGMAAPVAPPLSPGWAPPGLAMGMGGGGIPAPPMLGVAPPPAFDPEREALLRYLGMI